MEPRTITITVVLLVVITSIGVGLSWFINRNRGKLDTRGWTIVRQLANDDDLTTTVVEISPESVKDRSVYDAAVTTLCSLRKHGNICIIGFFLPGDNSPTTGRLVKWGDFKTLAVWWGNDFTSSKEYTVWDCTRAGVEGSPPSTLCGVGVKEAYDVALRLGLRQGTGEFCHWPLRGDIPATLSTLLSDMAKYGREEQLKSAYAKMVESGRNVGRTERGYDCSAYHAKVDALVDEAVSNWRAAMSHGRNAKRPEFRQMARWLLVWISMVRTLISINQVWAEQPDIEIMLGSHGSCDELIIAGKKDSCTPDNSVLYTHLRNGRALITVGTADGRVVGFVGEKDSQPQPQVYWLYLSRIRIGSRGSEHLLDVAGQCIIRMTKDGLIWSRVDCDATDENSARYRLHFRSDGRPVDVLRGKHRPS